jgi:transposase-like protein
MRCPYCGETVLIEYDPAMKRWACAVCARDWWYSEVGARLVDKPRAENTATCEGGSDALAKYNTRPNVV